VYSGRRKDDLTACCQVRMLVESGLSRIRRLGNATSQKKPHIAEGSVARVCARTVMCYGRGQGVWTACCLIRVIVSSSIVRDVVIPEGNRDENEPMRAAKCEASCIELVRASCI
jgi:hypothetical protein